MKPLYVKKNGTVNKVSGVAMPNTFPANRVGYDNTASELEATNTQDAIDEVVDIVADKVDKVSSATNGNLAGLDASGNLTDAGWSADKTITSATGNPISISGLKSNQLAIGPIITLEPIQAGSGDPSPNNIRAISGYDKIEVLSCGKNLLKTIKPNTAVYTNTNAGQEYTNDDCCLSNIIHIKQGVTYYVSWQDKPTNVLVAHKYNKDGSYVGYYFFDNGFSFDDCDYIKIQWNGKTSGDGSVLPTNAQVEVGSTATTYESYKEACDIQLTLGQTIYGGTLDVEKGILTVDRKCIDLGDLEYYYDSSNKQYYSLSSIDDAKIPSQSMITEGMICSKYVVDARHYEELSTVHIRGIYYVDRKIYIAADSNTYTFTGVQFVYPLATPYTIQLTPHEISLLKDYAYASTNGTNITFDYHNGEMASLADVAQLGQTVNELGNEFAKGDLYASPIIRSVPWLPHATRALSSIYIDNSSKKSDESAFKDAIVYVSSNLPDAKGYEGVTLIYVKAPTNVASIYMTPYGQNYCSGIIISFNNIIMFRYGLGSWNWDILKQW